MHQTPTKDHQKEKAKEQTEGIPTETQERLPVEKGPALGGKKQEKEATREKEKTKGQQHQQ